MSVYYYASESNGNYLFDNFPSEVLHLAKSFSDSKEPILVEINGIKSEARIIKVITPYGTLIAMSTEKRFVTRKKLFKQFIEVSALSLKSLIELQRNIVSKQTTEAEDFMHNVVSINGYSIQELFTLIPEKVLRQNYNNQKDTIKKIIEEKPNVTIATLQKIIKYNMAMKVEFSVFEQTKKASTTVKKTQYSIREVIISILYTFIDDFESLGIEISLDAGEASERRIDLDYDSFSVSLFYILDNSLKYCKPKTTLKIIFVEESDAFSILFKMISIKINPNEIPKLTDYGYRSPLAREKENSGKGIGLNRVIKTLKFSGATLEITPRINDYTGKSGKIDFEGNQFKIRFIGQQNWFNKVV